MRRPRLPIVTAGLAAAVAIAWLGSDAQACHKKKHNGCYPPPPPSHCGGWHGHYGEGWGGHHGGMASGQTTAAAWTAPGYVQAHNAGYQYGPQGPWDRAAPAPAGYNTTGYTVNDAGQGFAQGFVAGAAGMPNPAYGDRYRAPYGGYGAYGAYPGSVQTGMYGQYPYRTNNSGYGLGRRIFGR